MIVHLNINPIENLTEATHLLLLDCSDCYLTQYKMYEIQFNDMYGYYFLDDWGEINEIEEFNFKYQLMRCELK